MAELSAFKGRWALVTGASAGIGVALARELAAAGAKLVITARRRDRLDALAAELGAKYNSEVRVVEADLNDRSSGRELYDGTEGSGIAIDVLVNNAGLGQYGEFAAGKLDQELMQVEVNCAATVHLTWLFVPRMIERKRGWIMIVSSMASFQPVPYLSTYAATKAFDRYLSEGLGSELGRHGINVSALCPGPTESEFFAVAGTREDRRKKQPADEVARLGLEGLANGRAAVIPYMGGKVMAFSQRLFPRSLVVALAGRMFRPEHLK